MSVQHSARRPSRRLRLGLVLALLLAIGGMTVVRQLYSQAQSTPFTPDVAAYFSTDNKLVVAVTMAEGERKAAGLSVELFDAQNNSVSQLGDQAKIPETPGSFRF